MQTTTSSGRLPDSWGVTEIVVVRRSSTAPQCAIVLVGGGGAGGGAGGGFDRYGWWSVLIICAPSFSLAVTDGFGA